MNWLEDLPNDYGKGSLTPNREIGKRLGRTAMQYASITSLALSLATIAMAAI